MDARFRSAPNYLAAKMTGRGMKAVNTFNWNRGTAMKKTAKRSAIAERVLNITSKKTTGWKTRRSWMKNSKAAGWGVTVILAFGVDSASRS